MAAADRKKRYFGTDGIRGRVGENPINAEFILKLGWAAGRVFAENDKDSKVIVGKDTRISGYMFESALEAGLSAAGVDILLLGPMPTPGISYLTRTFRAQAGIVISASHNPYYDNGIKFFSAEGCKLPDEIEFAIEDHLDQPFQTVDSSKLGKAERVVDAEGRYVEFCKSTVPSAINLRDFKIVVDCAHGAAYKIGPSVFYELGAEVIELGADPDGLNINLDVGSTKPKALQIAVLENQADLGIAFDGDGDRVIMVDHEGRVIDGDEMLYIIAMSRHSQEQLGGGVVGTLMSNLGLEQALAKHDIELKRAKVGDRYVMEYLQKYGYVLGGESSGHIICLDRTTTGDGIISALQVLAEMVKAGKSLKELGEGMVKHPQHMVNVKMSEAVDVLAMPEVQALVSEAEAQLMKRGRVLLRPSGTEPVVRVMVEGEDKTEVVTMAEQLAERVKELIGA